MWSSLHIHFSNDYFPSRDRYDSLRWEEDERYIMSTLPDSLTDRHSIIRQDYRASVNVGIDDATIYLLPFCTDYECVELDAQRWKLYFSGYSQKIFPGSYFRTDSASGRMVVREYLFDIMNLLSSSEAFVGFDPKTDLKNISSSKFARYTVEDLMKGKAVPQFFRDTFDDCYARLEELQTMFPEYEIDSISLLGESILPVKKDGKPILLDIKTSELAFPEPVDDYQMYKDKLYIAANNKVIVCDSKGNIIKEYKQKDWDRALLWE